MLAKGAGMKFHWKQPFTLAKALWRSFTYLLAGRPVIAPKAVIEVREAKCNACVKNLGGWCQICSCLVEAKVLLSAEQCPDDPPRWMRLTGR